MRHRRGGRRLDKWSERLSRSERDALHSGRHHSLLQRQEASGALLGERRTGRVTELDIDQLPAAVVIARRSRRLVQTNLFLALGINLAVIALAATVGLPLWLSVLSDSGGLLVVLANSLWPLTWRVGAAAGQSEG